LKKNFLTDKKKILVFSPPFSGHLNILKEMIRDNQKDFDFRLIINGWKNIKPNLTGFEEFKTEIIERHDLAETDPALWTFPRVADQLESCLTIAEEFKPDLIIYDFFSVEGYLAGKKLNIPYWCSIPAMIGPTVGTISSKPARKARGTAASPTQVLSGDNVGAILASGYTSGGAWSGCITWKKWN